MMPTYIIHKDGVYNLYTTVADGPYFNRGLTLAQLEEYTREQDGKNGLRELPERLKRAHATGCSAIHTMTLEECVSCNRAGPDESCVPLDQFITQFLTTPDETTEAAR